MWRAVMSSRWAAWVVGFVSVPKARQLQRELDMQRLYVVTQVHKAAQEGRASEMRRLIYEVGSYGGRMDGMGGGNICRQPAAADAGWLSRLALRPVIQQPCCCWHGRRLKYQAIGSSRRLVGMGPLTRWPLSRHTYAEPDAAAAVGAGRRGGPRGAAAAVRRRRAARHTAEGRA